MHKRLLVLAVSSALSFCAVGQDRPKLLDIMIVKVKADKATDFDAIAKKMADANRKNKGDRWLAWRNEYGDQNVITFSSSRPDFAAIDSGSNAFEGAMKEAFGPAAPKLFSDWTRCLDSSRGEIRMRRWDLSWNVPADMGDIYKTVGQARFLYNVAVRVRPGHSAPFEQAAMMLKEAAERHESHMLTLVTQSSVGEPGLVYYYTRFMPSLAAMDSMPTNRRLMGERYDELQKSMADHIVTTEVSIGRLLPALSNPPEEIASADPKFWTPKPAPMSMPSKPAAPKGAEKVKPGL
jgi:quinol monooxygenase YgiN